MTRKMLELIECLEYRELAELERELSTARKLSIKSMVSSKLKEIEQRDNKQCATCGDEMKKEAEPLTLLFGPADFKKKASFCALDCLEYFFVKLKKISETKLKEVM